MVRVVGVEPTRIAPQEPKGDVTSVKVLLPRQYRIDFRNLLGQQQLLICRKRIYITHTPLFKSLDWTKINLKARKTVTEAVTVSRVAHFL